MTVKYDGVHLSSPTPSAPLFGSPTRLQTPPNERTGGLRYEACTRARTRRVYVCACTRVDRASNPPRRRNIARLKNRPLSEKSHRSCARDTRVTLVCVIFVARQAYEGCTVRLCQFEGNTC